MSPPKKDRRCFWPHLCGSDHALSRYAAPGGDPQGGAWCGSWRLWLRCRCFQLDAGMATWQKNPFENGWILCFGVRFFVVWMVVNGGVRLFVLFERELERGRICICVLVVCLYMYMNININIYIYMYIHTCIYMYNYVWLSSRQWFAILAGFM